MPGETVLVIDDSPTILKVVQLVLTKARYRVETAEDGEAGLEMARTLKPALILLDFVMPRMNGYQFCREMASDPELKDIPIVLMSAKGDQIGERFVTVMGVVDYITKPFSPEAISSVVQHNITKYARRSTNLDAASRMADGSVPVDRAATVDGAQGEQLDEDAAGEATVDVDLAEVMQQVERARKEALDQARDRIAELLVEQSRADTVQSAEPDLDEDAYDTMISTPNPAAALARRMLSDDELAAIISRAAPAVLGDSQAALQGNLRVVPIAEVLQLLKVQEQTGILTVHQDTSRAAICFRKGMIDLATITGVSEEFLLGRFIVAGEYMSSEDFDGFIESRAPGSRLIGTQLVQLGYLREGDLQAALQKQTCAIVYEILRWRFGSFTLASTRNLPFAATDAALGLDVETILMEGLRRADEWHLIEREVDDFDLVFLRNEDAVARLGQSRLDREELAILELVNGKNTVKDIIRRSRMSSFDVSRLLHRLLSIKVIRRRVMPVAV